MPALQRPGVDLAQPDAAAGDLGLFVPLVAGPRQRVGREGVDEPAALVAAQVGALAVGRDVGVGQQAVGEPGGQRLADGRRHQPAAGRAQRVVPGPGRAVGPAHRDRLVGTARPGQRRQVRHVQDGRAAVAPVREQEPPGRLERAPAPGRADLDTRHGHAGQVGVRGRLGDQRRERGVGRLDPVARLARERQPPPVAPGLGDRQPARRHDDGAGLDRGPVRQRHPPAGRGGRGAGDARREPELGAGGSRGVDERVADVGRPVRRREQLARLGLERQRHAQVVLEKPSLGVERPRLQHPPEQPRRRVGREQAGVGRRREHVAPAAAGHHDLLAALARPLQHDGRGARPGREHGRGQPGRAGADDHDGGGGRGHGGGGGAGQQANGGRAGRMSPGPLRTASSHGRRPTCARPPGLGRTLAVLGLTQPGPRWGRGRSRASNGPSRQCATRRSGRRGLDHAAETPPDDPSASPVLAAPAALLAVRPSGPTP